MKIDVTNLQDRVPVRQRVIRRAARAALDDLIGCYSVVVVDNARMAEINQRHLGRDEPTDVIAFAFKDALLTHDDCAGEIIVSADVAADEAERRSIDVEAELSLYVVHGALHLAGFDDDEPERAERMHERERQLLADIGYDADRLWKPLQTDYRGPEG